MFYVRSHRYHAKSLSASDTYSVIVPEADGSLPAAVTNLTPGHRAWTADTHGPFATRDEADHACARMATESRRHLTWR